MTLREVSESLPTTATQTGTIYRCSSTCNMYLVEQSHLGDYSIRMLVVSESNELMKPVEPCVQNGIRKMFDEMLKGSTDKHIKGIYTTMYHPNQNK
jgi:hypothetical protein